MAYVRLTDTQIAVDTPEKSADWIQMRDNQDDHETRISGLSGLDTESIFTDFATGQLDTTVWETGGTAPLFTAGDHFVQVRSSTYSVIAGLPNRIRIQLDQEMRITIEFRIKRSEQEISTYTGGWQDAGLAVGASTIITDYSDFVGIRRGSTAGTWRGTTGSGGVNTDTSDFGNNANWTKFKITIDTIGTDTVSFYSSETGDPTLVGGGTITTNIPTGVVLRPVFGPQNGAAEITNLQVDYCLAYFTARPLMP